MRRHTRVDRIKGSRLHNLKELRPASSGASEVRILFVFDPERRAVLLIAGDVAGDKASTGTGGQQSSCERRADSGRPA
nr:type II toxin-antitoxin system RelE/ParE family toxin [Frankia umida]